MIEKSLNLKTEGYQFEAHSFADILYNFNLPKLF